MNNYYAIIPANVRYDLDLTPNAKLLYGEITSLCNKEGYCNEANSYFSHLYNVDDKSIQRWLNSLEEKNYIKKENIKEDASRPNFVTERRLYIVADKNVRDDSLRTKLSGGHNIYNNIDNNINNNINILDNNNYISILSRTKHENTTDLLEKTTNKKQQIVTEIDKIITYMNNVCHTRFKSNTNSTKRHIKARLNEGYTFDDFKDVIDSKYKQWGENPKMFSTGQMSNTYLRPSTLFSSSHFEEYLQQAWLEQLNSKKEIKIESNDKLSERSELKF